MVIFVKNKMATIDDLIMATKAKTTIIVAKL